MKLCVAINHHGKAAEYEDIAQKIWEACADPESELGAAYLYKDGKPLMVNYCWYDEFEAMQKLGGEYGGRFSGMWASRRVLPPRQVGLAGGSAGGLPALGRFHVPHLLHQL